jgi:hypothetical protein
VTEGQKGRVPQGRAALRLTREYRSGKSSRRCSSAPTDVVLNPNSLEFVDVVTRKNGRSGK